MSVVSVRLVGDEQSIKQAREELVQTFGGRIDLVSIRQRGNEEWVALGTMIIRDEQQPVAVNQPAEVQTMAPFPAPALHPDMPVFNEQMRVRVRSTGQTGVIVAVTPATTMLRQQGHAWRYLVQFEDGRQSSYVAYALEQA
jgi:hypothetical protein